MVYRRVNGYNTSFKVCKCRLFGVYLHNEWNVTCTNALEASYVLVVLFYVGCVTDIVIPGMIFQPAGKGVLFQLRQTVHRTPMTISTVKLIGADLKTLAKRNIFAVRKELSNIAVFRCHIRKITFRSFGYGKSEIICYQPFQPFKHPKKNQVFFCNKFVRNVRIGNSVFGNGICCKN